MTLAKCRGEDPEGGPDVLGGGIKGSLCGGGWVSETRGLSWWPVGDKSRFDDLSDGNPGENASSSAGANAPGWVVPLPMSDSNLSPFAGSRVKSPATGRTSCGRRTVPTEYPTQGMQEICVCCASSAGSSGHRQIACLLLREHLRSRAQNGDADAGSMAAVRGSGHHRKCGLGFGSEESSRTAQTTGQGCVGRRMPKSHPTSTTYVIASLGFLCDPLSAWAAPLPSSAVATRGRASAMDSRVEKRHLGHQGLAQT